jgi:hypothetical protein
VALGQLQADAELGLEVDIEVELENMKNYYLTHSPAEFVEAVSQYIAPDYDEEGENELLEDLEKGED